MNDIEISQIERVAAALERLAPRRPAQPDFNVANAFVWRAAEARLAPIARVNRVDLDLLRGIDGMREALFHNTDQFARGLPANNALLWGARGMGKSSLVKAVHAKVAATSHHPLKLIEIHREDIDSLPLLMNYLRAAPLNRFIIFCDDLSFEAGDVSYKSLKAALEGGVEGRPDNVLFYATSNRRHLIPRDVMDNESANGPSTGDAVEEKISLSDRFGLWLGFHKCSLPEYLTMINAYCEYYGLSGDRDALHSAAMEWANTRGARSGRTAWQYIQDLAGRQGVHLRGPGDA